MKRILTTAAIFAAVMICVPAMATVTWDGGASDGKWSSQNNWDTNTVPTPTDDVVLPVMSGKYDVSMDGTGVSGTNSGYARTIRVHNNCTLKIEDKKTLQIGDPNDTTDWTSYVNGRIRLESDESIMSFVGSNVHTLNLDDAWGSTSIDGLDASSQIQIADGKTLTSYVRIEGKLRIVPSANTATLNNYGLVSANRNGILELGSNTILGDDRPSSTSDGCWSVEGGTLQFRRAATLVGTFDVQYGTLDIDETLTDNTNGCLTFTGGSINVKEGKTGTFE
jgi:hypothetical protein